MNCGSEPDAGIVRAGPLLRADGRRRNESAATSATRTATVFLVTIAENLVNLEPDEP